LFHTCIGGDPKLKLSSSSKKEAASCVEMMKSSKDAFGPETATDFAGNTGHDAGMHSLFEAGGGRVEGLAVVFRFKVGPNTDFGSCEALSFASSISSPTAKGPGWRHFPAIFLDEVKGLLVFAVGSKRCGAFAGVTTLLFCLGIGNSSAGDGAGTFVIGFCSDRGAASVASDGTGTVLAVFCAGRGVTDFEISGLDSSSRSSKEKSKS
jgi:hypothetical protein